MKISGSADHWYWQQQGAGTDGHLDLLQDQCRHRKDGGATDAQGARIGEYS